MMRKPKASRASRDRVGRPRQVASAAITPNSAAGIPRQHILQIPPVVELTQIRATRPGSALVVNTLTSRVAGGR